jgi:hypothetical protein
LANWSDICNKLDDAAIMRTMERVELLTKNDSQEFEQVCERIIKKTPGFQGLLAAWLEAVKDNEEVASAYLRGLIELFIELDYISESIDDEQKFRGK